MRLFEFVLFLRKHQARKRHAAVNAIIAIDGGGPSSLDRSRFAPRLTERLT